MVFKKLFTFFIKDFLMNIFKRKFTPAEYRDRVMSLNRLEDRNCLKKLNYIQKENRFNIQEIERNMQKISLELLLQKRLLEKIKNDRRADQLSSNWNLLLSKRQTKSANASTKYDGYSKENEFEIEINEFKRPIIRNQTANPRSHSKMKSSLSKRASTAHPSIRESKSSRELVSKSQIEENDNSKLGEIVELKPTDEQNEMLFIRANRVKSSSISGLRKPPIAVSKSANSKLRQFSTPILPNFEAAVENKLSKMDVFLKFQEIFYNYI
jgi:hypothetical protein